MGFMPIDDIRVDDEFARRLPLLADREFHILVEDIKARGVLVDLFVTKDRLLLDGHRRLAAAKVANLSSVPVKVVEIEGPQGWEEATSLALNLYRRHLSEAQRACLGSSLLRIEREKAKTRQHEGQERGRQRRTHGNLVQDGDHPKPKTEQRASQAVAETVGVSRQTLERVEAVKAKDPQLARKMLMGEISITGAYRQVKLAELVERAKARGSGSNAEGIIELLEHVCGRYRTAYVNPPWNSFGNETETTGDDSVVKQHLKCSLHWLHSLPIRNLAHKDGCHFWVWSPWARIRKANLHSLIDAWKLRWVAELIWDQGGSGKGRWFHARTEVLVLAVVGNLPLLRSDLQPIISAKRNPTWEKPEAFYQLIESISSGPRIQLFTKQPRDGWDTWLGVPPAET